MTTLGFDKKIKNDDKTKYYTFFSKSKAEIIINDSDIHGMFKSICTSYIKHTKIFRKRFRVDY